MTQKEFIQLAGFEPEDFAKVHDLYLETSLCKEDFCKDYIDHHNSLIIEDLADRVYNLSGLYKRLQEDIRALGWRIFRKAVEYSDDELYGEAIKILGIEECVKCKIKKNLLLWDVDREYLIKELK